MPLSKKHLQDICLLYTNDSGKCRYLAQDDMDWTKHYCVKLTQKKDKIDEQTNDFISATKKQGKDPYKQNAPLGDNCDGYPIFKFIEVGYDKD